MAHPLVNHAIVMITWLTVRIHGFQAANQIVHFSNLKGLFTRRFLKTRCQINWRIPHGEYYMELFRYLKNIWSVTMSLNPII